MICGNFKESMCKEIRLNDVGKEHFLTLTGLACGKKGLPANSISEVLHLGQLADCLQMDAVRTELEGMLWQELRVENCVEMIEGSEARGLECLKQNCYIFVRDHFEIASQEKGFLKLSEKTMENLLAEDELRADREEDVFEGLVRWMREGGKGLRGLDLLRKIRYGVIRDEYLTGRMLSQIPGHRMLEQLAGEVRTKRGGRAGTSVWDGVERLCDKWMVARGMKGRILAANVLKDPGYLAIDRQGQIIVSDRTKHQIIVFNRNGSVVRHFGSYGSAPGKFQSPEGVAVYRQSLIVVADKHNHRIQILNAYGSSHGCFASRGSDVGKLMYPEGVAIDRDGHIVVADNGNSRIQVFRPDGSVVRHFASYGSAMGEVLNPTDVAVDRAGRIVVADKGNHRVQVFNPNGSVALCFGSQGDGLGQLEQPGGVALDRDGRFIVADTGNKRVQVFNPDGRAARVINAAGDGGGQLRFPIGVVVDGTGRIVVAEGNSWGLSGGLDGNHRIQVLWAELGPGASVEADAPYISWQHAAVPSISAKKRRRGAESGDDLLCSLPRLQTLAKSHLQLQV